MRFCTRENRKWIIVGSVISVLLLSCLICLHIPKTPPKFRITGSEPFVYHESGLVVIVTKEKYRKKFNDALNTDSTFGIMLQLLMGRIIDVENNTKVEILDEGIYDTKVKVLGGEYASKVGWVPNEWIKHSK